MADLLHQKQVTNKFTVAALLISDDVLDDLRKAIRRLGSGIKVEVDYLRALLTNEIIKRDLIDSEEAKAAFQNVKRLQRTAARKKSSEKELEEKPIMAPVEDARYVWNEGDVIINDENDKDDKDKDKDKKSGYLPRAAVGTSEKVH